MIRQLMLMYLFSQYDLQTTEKLLIVEMQQKLIEEQSMYVHFDLLCKGETQIKIHRLFRQSVREWTELSVVKRAVLTYHFNSPPVPDSLYVCLDIPAAESLEQTPSQIMQYLDKVCHEYNVKLNITDFKSDIEQAKRSAEQQGVSYYDDAPVEEILRFASVGTSIAFEFLEQLEEVSKGISWSDAELARLILLSLTKEFGSDYKWMDWALHFVCNPLLIREDVIISLARMCCSRKNQSCPEISNIVLQQIAVDDKVGNLG